LYLLVNDLNSSTRVTISPEAHRTDVEILDGERIITPSMTAWPPTFLSTQRKGNNINFTIRFTVYLNFRNKNSGAQNE
jgi:hypothetical protein